MQNEFLVPQMTELNLIYVFVYICFLFLAALGLLCCVRLFLVLAIGGCSLVAVHRVFIAVASLLAEHRLKGS